MKLNNLHNLEARLLRISREVIEIEDELFKEESKYGTIRAKIQDALSDLMWSKLSLTRAVDVLSKARASRKAQEID